MSPAAPLLFRAGTRIGYLAAAAVSGALAIAALLSALALDRVGVSLLVAALGVAYLWVAVVAVRLGVSRPLVAVLDPQRLAIVHRVLLSEPIVVHRDNLLAVHVDPRPWNERRVAAGIRSGGAVRPTFHESRRPVVSAAPSAHADRGTGAPPNLVLRFRADKEMPAVPLTVRGLITVTQGRGGRFQGPRGGRRVPALRLVVEDLESLVPVLTDWGVLGTEPRDQRYLAPVDESDRRADRRRRRRFVMGTSATVLVLAAATLAARAV